MPKIIKNHAIVEDSWRVMAATEETQVTPDSIEAGTLVPLSLWLSQRECLYRRDDIGVWLKSDETVESLAEDLTQLPLIALHFPTFNDGRGFSNARLLRERYGYTGEIRAIGYVLQDQLCYLKRCGFNSYVLQPNVDLSAALPSLKDFTESYQSCADQQVPLFQRRD